MRRTSADSRAAWRVPALVPGPLALAVLASAAAPATGAGSAWLGPLWLAALAWTVAASLAGALARGLRHGDRSAFGRHRLPDAPDYGFDMDTKTGMYAYLRDEEDRLLNDDDWLR